MIRYLSESLRSCEHFSEEDLNRALYKCNEVPEQQVAQRTVTLDENG